MKKYILIFAVLECAVSNSFAYTKRWTPLFGDLVPTIQNAPCDGVLPYVEPSDEHDLGVLTLKFEDGEIGQDTFAVNQLAGVIAARHGGNKIYYVSGVVWKTTQEIESQTYRVVWKGSWPPKVPAIHKVYHTVKKTKKITQIVRRSWCSVLDGVSTCAFNSERECHENGYNNCIKNNP